MTYSKILALTASQFAQLKLNADKAKPSAQRTQVLDLISQIEGERAASWGALASWAHEMYADALRVKDTD